MRSMLGSSPMKRRRIGLLAALAPFIVVACDSTPAAPVTGMDAAAPDAATADLGVTTDLGAPVDAPAVTPTVRYHLAPVASLDPLEVPWPSRS